MTSEMRTWSSTKHLRACMVETWESEYIYFEHGEAHEEMVPVQPWGRFQLYGEKTWTREAGCQVDLIVAANASPSS